MDRNTTDERLSNATRQATIYEALQAKLGRPPTHEEIKIDVHRILQSVTIKLAGQSKLRFQRS